MPKCAPKLACNVLLAIASTMCCGLGISIGNPSWAEDAPAEEKRQLHFPTPSASEGVPLIPPQWEETSIEALTSGQLDDLLEKAQQSKNVHLAEAISDEQFIRRVYIDLQGKLPPVGSVAAFVALGEADKRANLIDKLLEGDGFARYQASYWRDVIQSRATEVRAYLAHTRGRSLEHWLYEQFQAQRSWAEITRSLLTAEGKFEVMEPTRGGEIGFLMCHTSEPEIARANDTARVFLGLNIQCAQCHDAPEHVWKRQQFHDLAAFFAKSGHLIDPQIERNYNYIAYFGTKPDATEYQTPDAYDPSVLTPTDPRFFITDAGPEPMSSDQERRNALADYVTDGKNYYFPAAMANRVWGRLMGQAFTRHMDDLGPLQTTVFPEILMRLAASFQASGYEIRSLYRTIMNSRAYQSANRLPERTGEHLQFTAICPGPVDAETLWQSLNNALGPIHGDQFVSRKSVSPFIPPLTLRDLFEQTFAFDPSINGRDVEETATQAMFLMNNVAINANIQAHGDTLLASVLAEFPSDRDAIGVLFDRGLARKPTEAEVKTSLEHVQEVGDRDKALEDILWVLINSTEFRIRN